MEHARLWAELESSGNMIGYYDLIVAATALEHEVRSQRLIGDTFLRYSG